MVLGMDVMRDNRWRKKGLQPDERVMKVNRLYLLVVNSRVFTNSYNSAYP